MPCSDSRAKPHRPVVTCALHPQDSKSVAVESLKSGTFYFTAHVHENTSHYWYKTIDRT